MKPKTDALTSRLLASILVIMIAALLLVIALSYWHDKKNASFIEVVQRDLKTTAKYQETGTAVFARKYVAAGTLFVKDCVEERVLRANLIPGQAAMRVSDVLGKKVRFAVEKGTIVSNYDLDPYPRYLTVTGVQATKLIRRGAPICDDAVELVHKSSEELPDGHCEKISEVLGRLARQDIVSGELLTKRLVVPRKFEAGGSVSR